MRVVSELSRQGNAFKIHFILQCEHWIKELQLVERLQVPSWFAVNIYWFGITSLIDSGILDLACFNCSILGAKFDDSWVGYHNAGDFHVFYPTQRQSSRPSRTPPNRSDWLRAKSKVVEWRMGWGFGRLPSSLSPPLSSSLFLPDFSSSHPWLESLSTGYYRA